MKSMSKKKQLLIGVTLAVVFLGGFEAFLGGDPKSVTELSDKIEKTQEWPQADGKTTLGIFIKQDSGTSGYIRLLSRKIEDISKGVVKYWPEKYDEIIWFAKVPAVDNFGNENDTLTVKMHFQMRDLKRINWDNVSHLQLLNFADIEKVTLLGRRVTGSFCSDPSQVEQAKNFCVQVLQHLRK